jgi:hypothetical protein
MMASWSSLLSFSHCWLTWLAFSAVSQDGVAKRQGCAVVHHSRTSGLPIEGRCVFCSGCPRNPVSKDTPTSFEAFVPVVLTSHKREVAIVSNSTLLRSEKYHGICGSDRRGFLKLAAAAIGGTAVASLLKAQPQQSASTSARMFDGFKISNVQIPGANINVVSGGPRSARVAAAWQPANARNVAQNHTPPGQRIHRSCCRPAWI